MTEVSDMQLFSEYLRDLLQTKGLTVSALSRLSGVERTVLSKTLTGQRVLPYAALDDLIYHLRLTPGEEQRLRAYYDTQFEKEGLRQSREIVGKLFSDLARLDFTAPAFEDSRLLLDLDGYAGTRSIFSGAPNVHSLLRLVLSQELTRPDARVELTVPPTDTFLGDELLRRYLDGRMGAQVRQIIAFDASGAAEDINLHNLECFCRVLPICLLSKRHYHPYYYYDDSIAARYTDPFPYFLVTHGCTVCLSEDGAQAMLLRGTDQVEQYRRHFQTLLERCHPLIQYTSTDAPTVTGSIWSWTSPVSAGSTTMPPSAVTCGRNFPSMTGWRRWPKSGSAGCGPWSSSIPFSPAAGWSDSAPPAPWTTFPPLSWRPSRRGSAGG